MMDDIAEQQDVAREISDAISNPVAFGHDIDEVNLSQVSFLTSNIYFKSNWQNGYLTNKFFKIPTVQYSLFTVAQYTCSCLSYTCLTELPPLT